MRNFTDIYQLFGINNFYEIKSYTVDMDIVHDSAMCGKCKTPLYDMYYCVVDVNSLKGTAFCAVCMHLEKNCGNYQQLLNGQYIRKVCKMKHKNTLSDILNIIPVQPYRKHQEYIQMLNIFSKYWEGNSEITHSVVDEADILYDSNSRIVLFSNLRIGDGTKHYLKNLEKINTIVTAPTAIYKIKYYWI